MNDHPIEGMLNVSMEKIREMVDVNTIIGEPITTLDGTTVIPVSKVGFGFGSGGSDIGSKTDKTLFGGGAGAGVTISPLAFLVVSKDKVELLQIEKSGSAEKIFTSFPETFEKFMSVLNKNKSNKSDEKKDKNHKD